MVVELSHVLVELVLVAVVTFVLFSNILHQRLPFSSLIVLGTLIELCLHSADPGFKFSIFLHIRLNFFILPVVPNCDFRFAVNWSLIILTDSNPCRFSQFWVFLSWRGFCSINSTRHFKFSWADTCRKTFSFCHLIVLLSWALPVSSDSFCHSIQGSFLVLSMAQSPWTLSWAWFSLFSTALVWTSLWPNCLLSRLLLGIYRFDTSFVLTILRFVRWNWLFARTRTFTLWGMDVFREDVADFSTGLDRLQIFSNLANDSCLCFDLVCPLWWCLTVSSWIDEICGANSLLPLRYFLFATLHFLSLCLSFHVFRNHTLGITVDLVWAFSSLFLFSCSLLDILNWTTNNFSLVVFLHVLVVDFWALTKFFLTAFERQLMIQSSFNTLCWGSKSFLFWGWPLLGTKILLCLRVFDFNIDRIFLFHYVDLR